MKLFPSELVSGVACDRTALLAIAYGFSGGDFGFPDWRPCERGSLGSLQSCFCSRLSYYGVGEEKVAKAADVR
jgi:hypothetical protein